MTTPTTPQPNGISERDDQALENKNRCMLRSVNNTCEETTVTETKRHRGQTCTDRGSRGATFRGRTVHRRQPENPYQGLNATSSETGTLPQQARVASPSRGTPFISPGVASSTSAEVAPDAQHHTTHSNHRIDLRQHARHGLVRGKAY